MHAHQKIFGARFGSIFLVQHAGFQIKKLAQTLEPESNKRALQEQRLFAVRRGAKIHSWQFCIEPTSQLDIRNLTGYFPLRSFRKVLHSGKSGFLSVSLFQLKIPL